MEEICQKDPETNIKGLMELAMLFREGRFVDQNIEKFERYLKLAANNGHSDAQFKLGEFYHKGQESTSSNLKEAAKYYSRAAYHGNAEAKAALAELEYKQQPTKSFEDLLKEKLIKEHELNQLKLDLVESKYAKESNIKIMTELLLIQDRVLKEKESQLDQN